VDDKTILDALRGHETTDVIRARLGMPAGERNELASVLHTLARAGQCLRKQGGGDWTFAALDSEKFTTVTEEEYPSWARRPVWVASDGPFQDVWANKPPGHRCLFSCQWAGLKSANETHPLEDAPRGQWYFELADLAARGNAEAGAIVLEVEPRDAALSWARWEKRAYDCLLEARRRYPETANYVAPWALTPRIKRLRWRPGYEVILPCDQRLAPRHGDGVWLFLSPEHPTGIALSQPEPIGGPSDAEERFADKAVAEATALVWGRR